MTAMRFDDLRQYSDVLHSRHGYSVTVRFVEPRDAEALQNYFRALTTRSRYNRLLGAASDASVETVSTWSSSRRSRRSVASLRSLKAARMPGR